MRNDSSAADGRHALGPSRLASPRGDAFRSPYLIEHDGVLDPSTLDPGALAEPMAAARQWLDDEARTNQLSTEARSLALRALEVGQTYSHELDLLARGIAHGATDTGDVDQTRLQELATRMEHLLRFSTSLRLVIDSAMRADSQATEQLLAQALEQSEGPQGLLGLLAVLERDQRLSDPG